MSHYLLEICVPQSEIGTAEAAIGEAVAQTLAPFCEHEDNYRAFWDWYVIGGRFSGSKKLSRYDPEKLAAFEQWLVDSGAKVSGIQFGKQELVGGWPKKVDAKWAEMFGVQESCPMFLHSGQKGPLDGDICLLSEARSAKACRAIFAHKVNGKWKAMFMLETEFWNGVTWQKTTWDGTLGTAETMMLENTKRWLVAPPADWLTITVDYHS